MVASDRVLVALSQAKSAVTTANATAEKNPANAIAELGKAVEALAGALDTMYRASLAKRDAT